MRGNNNLEENKRDYLFSAIIVLLIVATVAVLYIANTVVCFMMDDLWYSTNLQTGNMLKSTSDVFVSQVWHWFNWGGRSINHAFLQFSLMSGETVANIINTVAVLLTAYEISFICKLFSTGESRSKCNSRLFFTDIARYAIVLSLIIVCCPDIKLSMLWQSGCANYVYSTVWILAYYIVYLRTLYSNLKDLKLVHFFIVPLGIITGWSTENMGPSAFCVAVLIIFLCLKQKNASKGKLVWMIEGAISAFAGSVLCILAPGNFVRKEIGNEEMASSIEERFLQMFRGIGEYLFPALLFLAIAFLVYRSYSKNEKLSQGSICVMTGAILSYGAMILSPHYPDRAAYGTCILIEICAMSLLDRCISEKNKLATTLLSCFLLIPAMLKLGEIINL